MFYGFLLTNNLDRWKWLKGKFIRYVKRFFLSGIGDPKGSFKDPLYSLNWPKSKDVQRERSQTWQFFLFWHKVKLDRYLLTAAQLLTYGKFFLGKRKHFKRSGFWFIMLHIHIWSRPFFWVNKILNKKTIIINDESGLFVDNSE